MSSGHILLEIQTNDDVNINERRFPCNMSIVDLKSRLELITGASAGTMQLTFYDTSGGLIGQPDDSKYLEDYLPPGAEQRLRLSVKDSNAVRLTDFGDVPKYEMSTEEYEKRNESVLAFKLRNNLGRFGAADEKKDQLNLEIYKIGERCEVTVKNHAPRRGKIMYVGKLNGKSGNFIGVRYDEPCGKNNGTFEGIKYFECPQNYGSFVRPSDVQVGDYPEDIIDFDN